MRFFQIAAVAAMACAVPALAMEPGEWQITTTASSPMLPQPQTFTLKQCIRKGDGEDPAKLMGEQPADCKVSVRQKSASGYAWDVECPKEGMRGGGSVSFTRDSMQGEMKVSGSSGGQKFEMVTRMSGQRLGPCK